MVEGALALADAEGLEAVTVRRLAKELGVTPMALYWHFRSKGELLDGMAAGLFEEVDPSVEASVGWQEQLRALLGSVLDVLRAHPSTATLLSTRTASSEGSLRATEAVLDVLRRGGFRRGKRPRSPATRSAASSTSSAGSPGWSPGNNPGR